MSVRKVARPGRRANKTARTKVTTKRVLLSSACILLLSSFVGMRTLLMPRVFSPAPQATPTPTPALTKEYIYAGGRLIAIEEGAGAQTPYPDPAVPHALPGTIQIEDFDNGGEGVAYHDIDSHFSPEYRTGEHVWIENCANLDGHCNVGSTWGGEWLEYTVQVAAAGTYNVETSVASGNGCGGTFRFDLDGVPVTGTLTVPATAGWQSYQTVTTSMTLLAGQHVMRLSFLGNGPQNGAGNYNYFRITSGPVGSPPTGFLATAATSAQAGSQVLLTWTNPTSGGNVDHYEVERKVSLADANPVLFNCASSPCPDTSASVGAVYLYRVRAVFSGGGLSDFSNRDLALTHIFTDDPLNPNGARTTIRANHFTEIRDAINALRIAVGLPVFGWNQETPQSGIVIRASHYNDSRDALAQALGQLGLPGPQASSASIGTRVTSQPVQELRNLMR